jgi:membrane fusion protein, macrolide-specific efflux system
MSLKNWFGFKTLLMALVMASAAWGIKVKWFSEPPAPQVITNDVEVGDLEDTVLATGVIRPVKQVSVGAQVSGQIKKLYVVLGDVVKQGQLIAEIDATPQNNALRNAEAALQNFSAQRQAKQAALEQALLALKRQQELMSQDATSRQNLEAAQASVNTLQADAKALDAQIQQQRISTDTARVNLGYTRILAPMNGVVSAVVSEEGRTVNANQSAPTIIKVAALDTVTVKAQISEADVVRVRAGMPVYFTILGEPRKRYEARLRAIEPTPESEQTDATTTTTSTTTSAIYYNGLFEVPNPEGKLKVAMTAQVSIVLGTAKDALLIPSSALGKRGKDGHYAVRVLQGQGEQAKVVDREVKVGLNNRVQAEVLSGLKAGDKVVVGEASAEGGSKARTGAPRMF